MTDETGPESIRRRQERLEDDVDRILDEIDEPLTENAEEFVRSYVQKGGQGWSVFVNPSFFVGAATAGIVASVTYDTFKAVVARVVHLINRIPGPVETQVYQGDGSLDPEFEGVLIEAWESADALLRGDTVSHSIDEATALHWALFVQELLKVEPLVRIERKQFERLRQAGQSRPEKLTPTQMVAFIVAQWLAHNPNAEIGIWE